MKVVQEASVWRCLALHPPDVKLTNFKSGYIAEGTNVSLEDCDKTRYSVEDVSIRDNLQSFFHVVRLGRLRRKASKEF